MDPEPTISSYCMSGPGSLRLLSYDQLSQLITVTIPRTASMSSLLPDAVILLR